MALALSLALSLALGLTSSGCYHYAITSNGGDAEAGERKSETKWTFFWGLLEQKPTNVNEPGAKGEAPSCLADVPPSQVTAQTNAGYALLGLVTLGIVAPLELSWTCSMPSSTLPSSTMPDVAKATPEKR